MLQTEFIGRCLRQACGILDRLNLPIGESQCREIVLYKTTRYKTANGLKSGFAIAIEDSKTIQPVRSSPVQKGRVTRATQCKQTGKPHRKPQGKLDPGSRACGTRGRTMIEKRFGTVPVNLEPWGFPTAKTIGSRSITFKTRIAKRDRAEMDAQNRGHVS